ncbi:MAG: hypothetical protein M1608_15570 [Candidatus Omnitrophica bacterium]|nr:hypothetical protein [Candidatus Omnitrophota bacterium]
MNPNLFIGFSLVLLAGIMNGSFAVPMKYSKKWSWENIWLAWSFFALVLFPVLLTLGTVPRLAHLYSASGIGILGLVVSFGIGWGISQVLFGLGVVRVGVSVGFAIIVGLAAAVGSLVPLLVFQPGEVFSLSGLRVIGGVVMIVVGVILCAWAGSKKEKRTHPSPRFDVKSRETQTGIPIGIGGSMINLGFVFGAPILNQARQMQVPTLHQANALWLPLLVAGFGATSVYCARLLRMHHTWGNFFKTELRSYWMLALLMGVLWLGSVLIYGIAAGRLGKWGPIAGWPVFMSASIITANVWGWVTGEWDNSPAAARRLMAIGVVVLVVSIFVLGMAGQTGQ